MDAQPVELATGDYVIIRNDTDDERQNGIELLKQQGCRDWRVEPRNGGTITIHGFLRDGTAKYLS